MHILETAIEMEREGAAFYDNLAATAEDEGLKQIFSLLSDDERRHERIFRAMKDGAERDEIPLHPERADSLIAALDPKKFHETQEHKELYERALEIELKSIEFYTEVLEQLEKEEERHIVKRVIAEERKHYESLDTIALMLSRPKTWVEDAEFGVRDEY